ncbi:MAG: class I SAM-dependent methyltransferase [Verrucomicrobiota bacterium]|nr:class I SAM-dependent methyltransferase [Verrucomicrobiota bacterium]
MRMSEWIDAALVQAFEAEKTDAYRLSTGEDGWVERFGADVLVSHKTDAAQERLTNEFYLWSLSVGFKFARIFARFLPKKNAEREAPRLIVGEAESSLGALATERQLRYGIDFGAGYSCGLFLDQRNNRSFVRRSAPKKLLNCFAYTCSFSVAAASVDASTVNVDLSKKSLLRGRENFALNELPMTNHEFVAGDVMEFLPRLARKGEKFDTIILDPPTFSRSHRGKAFQVERDYETLLSHALELAERDARLLLSTNCTTLNARALEVVARFCLKASRRAGKLHSEPALPDFPAEAGASTVWLTLR